MLTSRAVAWEALRRIDDGGAYANLVLGPILERSKLGPQDRRFVTDLVYGTTRLRRACDTLVDRFVTRDPDPAIRSLLRLGAYQIVYGGVPAHAAVSETVAVAPHRAKGFVNAVLRRVADVPMVWPSTAARLSCPDWMLDLLVAEVGEEDAVSAFEAMNQPASVTTRSDGYVQDLASQWVAAAVAARSGERVLDACAAPGGKATAMASDGASVVAGDIRSHRLGLVAVNARRLGVRLEAVVADATRPPFRAGSFDAVLLDAPCSGLGALRRRPDARWRIGPHDVGSLAALQSRMLASVAPLVRPGGRLVYSVCTITASESIEHPVPPGFEPDDEPLPVGVWRRFGHGWRVLPQDADTDGMVIIRYRAVPS